MLGGCGGDVAGERYGGEAIVVTVESTFWPLSSLDETISTLLN